jgi:hypothetical protein
LRFEDEPGSRNSRSNAYLAQPVAHKWHMPQYSNPIASVLVGIEYRPVACITRADRGVRSAVVQRPE